MVVTTTCQYCGNTKVVQTTEIDLLNKTYYQLIKCKVCKTQHVFNVVPQNECGVNTKTGVLYKL